ncbi:MAG: hypothetical protein HYZ14_16440 [Bacteroidetes bacterium]|nr:hypothetical protein [Bacteroidota bacterium]
MKVIPTLLLILIPILLPAQLNQKYVEKPEGNFTYCYHQNGKISTEAFYTNASGYMAPGYAKAFDKSGNEIYNQPVSRTGLLSSVQFSYYENGAVKTAHYSSHPDAGIQWYEKTTGFDEAGKITSETEMSNDTWGTQLTVPDSTRERLEKENALTEQMLRTREKREKRDQFVKDSTAFYITSTENLEDGTVLQFIPDPEHGQRRQVITRKGKIIRTTTEFFIKTGGIQSITRTYFKNGRIHEEYTYEAQIWHYREYDQKGRIVQEILNQSVAHSE